MKEIEEVTRTYGDLNKLDAVKVLNFATGAWSTARSVYGHIDITT
jgi:hypothetical protein